MMLILMTVIWAGEPGVFGSQPSDSHDLITIAELRAEPESYLGRVVRVQGEVRDVCPAKGCWMDVADQGAEVRIKVRDGDIVFPQSLKGKRVVAEGTVYKFELSREEAVEYYAHQADEKGETFDPESVVEGITIYQIGGIGARVID